MEQKLACLQGQPEESFISLDEDAGVKSHSQRQGHVRVAPLPRFRLSAAEKNVNSGSKLFGRQRARVVPSPWSSFVSLLEG